MQDRFESHPDGYKFRIDEDTVVVFAYPSEFIDWAWQASINHMPSVSAVSIHRPRTVISPDGSSTTEGCEELFGQPIYIERHYENEEGRAQLEWILADQETMKNVIARLPR